MAKSVKKEKGTLFGYIATYKQMVSMFFSRPFPSLFRHTGQEVICSNKLTRNIFKQLHKRDSPHPCHIRHVTLGSLRTTRAEVCTPPKVKGFKIKPFVISEFLFLFASPSGHAVAYWIRHYATSWKVSGLRPDEVNEFVQFT
jgi:hypothetical protein